MWCRQKSTFHPARLPYTWKWDSLVETIRACLVHLRACLFLENVHNAKRSTTQARITHSQLQGYRFTRIRCTDSHAQQSPSENFLGTARDADISCHTVPPLSPKGRRRQNTSTLRTSQRNWWNMQDTLWSTRWFGCANCTVGMYKMEGETTSGINRRCRAIFSTFATSIETHKLTRPNKKQTEPKGDNFVTHRVSYRLWNPTIDGEKIPHWIRGRRNASGMKVSAFGTSTQRYISSL